LQSVKEFLWPVRVYYEDTDSGGVVYYANYLKFMERARTEWLRSFGIEQDELIREAGVLFAVRRVEVDYLLPARFNDPLVVSLRVLKKGKASILFKQCVYRQNDDTPLCEAVIKIACINAESFRACAIPKALIKIIK